MNTPHPHDLVIGLDRSDKKADLHFITPPPVSAGPKPSTPLPKRSGNGCSNSVKNSPKPVSGCAWNNRRPSHRLSRSL